MSANPKKIVIFAQSLSERDFFRSLLDSRFLVHYFDQEATCFDNLKSIRPQLVILRTDSISVIWRFFFAVSLLESKSRLLIVSDLMENSFHICGENGEPAVIDCVSMRQLCQNLEHLAGRVPADCKTRKEMQPVLIGQSSAMRSIRLVLPHLKNSADPVLISGGGGTGKEYLARLLMLDQESVRIKIECPELEPAIESCSVFRTRMNGHIDDICEREPGQAPSMVFLFNQIDSLTKPFQAEILLLIDDLSKRSKELNVRFIATAGMGLAEMVRRGAFRKDLYYRLNVIPLALPPLMQRPEDIPLLCDYFMIQACVRDQKSFVLLSDAAKHRLQLYPWPGNIEELQRLVIRIIEKKNEADIFSMAGAAGRSRPAMATFQPCTASLPDRLEIRKAMNDLKNTALKRISRNFIARSEKMIVQEALEYANWNRRKAAALLQISYKSFLNKMKSYQII